MKSCGLSRRYDAAGDRTLIAGAGVEFVCETVRLIEAAAKLGYHAALVLTPHYYRVQMLRAESHTGFFRAVADASPIPVLIYNFPQMTGIDLPLELVAQLAEHPNIVAIKESSADLAQIAGLDRGLPMPHAAQSIYDYWQSGDVQGSCAAQARIAEAAAVAPKYGIQG